MNGLVIANGGTVSFTENSGFPPSFLTRAELFPFDPFLFLKHSHYITCVAPDGARPGDVHTPSSHVPCARAFLGGRCGVSVDLPGREEKQ